MFLVYEGGRGHGLVHLLFMDLLLVVSVANFFLNKKHHVISDLYQKKDSKNAE
tara:strand:- start:365 stop:523 length:159 start_codon:yes stop_codon:yes gene_type:complete